MDRADALDDEPQDLAWTGSDPRDRSLAEDLRQLVDDGRALAEAEYAYQKSRAVFAGQGVKGIAIFGALAAALVFFALMALTVGLVIALTPVLTAWGAAGAAFAGLLLTAFICARIAQWRLRRMTRALAEGPDVE